MENKTLNILKANKLAFKSLTKNHWNFLEMGGIICQKKKKKKKKRLVFRFIRWCSWKKEAESPFLRSLKHL